MIAQLGVVRDYSRRGILGAHRTADVNCLDVGEVGKDPRSGCAGGLEATQKPVELQTERFPTETGSFPELVISNHLEAAAASVGRVDGEGEPDDWRADRLVHGSFALPVVKDIVEDELGLVVAGVDNRADLDGQADGGCATLHRDVRVFFNREAVAVDGLFISLHLGTQTDLARC